MTLSLLTLRILPRKLYLKVRICETKGTFSASSIHPPFSLSCVPPLSTLAYLTLSDSKEEGFFYFFFYFGVCLWVCIRQRFLSKRRRKEVRAHAFVRIEVALCNICLQKPACVFRHKGICVFSRPIYCQRKQLH